MVKTFQTGKFRPGPLFYRFLCVEALLTVGLILFQLAVVLPPDDNDWPLSILSSVNLAFAGCLAAFAGFAHGKNSIRRKLLATAALFVVFPILLSVLPDRTIDYQDWAAFFVWLVSFLLIGSILVEERAPAPIQALFICGILLQGVAMIGDAAFDDFFYPDVSVDRMDWVYVIGSSLSVISFVLGFQLFASKAISQSSYVKGKGEELTFYRGFRYALEYIRNVTGLSAVMGHVDHALWTLKNPGKTYSDYYVDRVSRVLDKGRGHSSLGKLERYASTPFSKVEGFKPQNQKNRGVKVFDKIVRLGLHRDHVCVDYGCGSLRIGQHAVEYLNPGNYWGLDVTDRFYREGIELVPAELIEEKMPRLRVISSESLAEVAAARPDFIFAHAVLNHVHPEEADAFFDCVLELTNEDTKVIISFRELVRGGRTGQRAWGWDVATLVRLVRDRKPDALIRLHREPRKALFGRRQWKSIIEITFPMSDR